jgi:hypothetical protein
MKGSWVLAVVLLLGHSTTVCAAVDDTEVKELVSLVLGE